MTQTQSKSRQAADVAFGKVQSQFIARSRVFEEMDQAVVARDEKTSRLREERLARESQERLSVLAAKPAKPGLKK
jgi:hypothetical protein